MRGVDPNVDIAATSGRASEVTEPLDFEDEPVMATVGSVVTSWPSGNFLKVNPSSSFKEFDMLKLRYKYQISSSMEIRTPLPHEHVDWNVQGWWSFYEFAFEAGFRFPMPKLVREVVSHFKIALSQMIPNAWRILMSLECIS